MAQFSLYLRCCFPITKQCYIVIKLVLRSVDPLPHFFTARNEVVFTRVCDSVHKGGGACSGGSGPGGVSGPGGGVCLLLGAWSWGVWFSGVPAPGGVPGRDPLTATAAGSTHPTGMHSCFF